MPSWVFIAIIGYFLGALAKVIDKIFLASMVTDVLIFTFWTSLVSLFAVWLIPFGFEWVEPLTALIAFASGVSFVAFLYFMFLVLKKFEVSRVVPIVAGVAPFVTLIFSYFFLGEYLGLHGIIAVFLLILGGVVLAVDLSSKNKFQWELLSISLVASVFLSAHFVFTKAVFVETTFINGFLWTRAGIVATAALLLCMPGFVRRLWHAQMPRPRNVAFFFVNKIIGALSLFALSLALKRGQASVVHALGGFEYILAFILTIIFSGFWPKIFAENKAPEALGVKFLGTLLLASALALLYIT